jgi:hypothetical protein
MKYLFILFAMIIIGCTNIPTESGVDSTSVSNYNSPAGIGFYVSNSQMDAITDLQKYHMDNFLDKGNLEELLWMAKGGNGHEPFQILVIAGRTDTLWLSPVYITGYIECEREIIGKSFDEKLEIQIVRTSTVYPINIYVTTIISER